MKPILKKYQSYLLGALIGAAMGFAYYYFVGCSNGTCAITSNPVNSTLYGGMMGVLLAGSFKKEEKQTTKN